VIDAKDIADDLGWLPRHAARVGSATKTGGKLWLCTR
jgi:hypothetical protein